MYSKILLGPGVEKGFLLLGAIFALQLKGYLNNIDEFIGVSVGSIVAFYINIDINFNDIFNEALNFNLFESWQDFNFISWFLTEGKSGIVKSNKIKERIDYWMKSKYGKSLTFEELWNFTGKKLTITITDRTDLDNPKAIYMNYENYPKYSVSTAIVESCSIPGIIELKNPNYVDGALSDPFPVELLDGNGIAFILRDENNVKDSNAFTRPFEKMIEGLMIPLQIITQQKIQMITEGVKAIILKRERRNIIPRKLTKDEKVEMINSGFKQTYNLL